MTIKPELLALEQAKMRRDLASLRPSVAAGWLFRSRAIRWRPSCLSQGRGVNTNKKGHSVVFHVPVSKPFLSLLIYTYQLSYLSPSSSRSLPSIFLINSYLHWNLCNTHSEYIFSSAA